MRFGGALVLLFPLLSPARAETQTSEASSSDVLTPRVGHELFGTFQNAFKLTRTGDSWTYTSLYDFTGGSDGNTPYGNVALDASGNLYGTATSGGSETGHSALSHTVAASSGRSGHTPLRS